MAYKKSELVKLESLVKESGFTIRYERGSFESGHCIVNEKKIIIINKFFRLKARIDCLEDIIKELHIVQDQNDVDQSQLEMTTLKVA
jgi:alpha-glucuronidase